MHTNHLHANGPIAPCAALCPFPCYSNTIMQHVIVTVVRWLIQEWIPCITGVTARLTSVTVMLSCAVLVSWQTPDLIRPCNTLLPPDSRAMRRGGLQQQQQQLMLCCYYYYYNSCYVLAQAGGV